MNRNKVKEIKQGPQASKSSGPSAHTASRPMTNTPRQKLREDDLPSVTLPGDIKERLQVKPETPPKKKPSGTEWREFKSEDRMGAVESDDCIQPRFKLALNNIGRDPSMDDDQAIQNRENQERLAKGGYTGVNKEVIKERGTDNSNEYLYEEVEDKETGDQGLLYRQNIFDRMV